MRQLSGASGPAAGAREWRGARPRYRRTAGLGPRGQRLRGVSSRTEGSGGGRGLGPWGW